MHENRRAIHVAGIAELPVLREGVDIVPEDVEQFLVRDLRRIVDDLDRFRMSGAAARHLVIGRVRYLATDISRHGGDYAFDLVEIGLDAPEAPAGEGGLSGHRR